MTLDVSSFLGTHPSLINEIGGHALAHALYSYMRRSRRRGISRRQMRKLSNRKRRWFVDNIIMHHKRLHDRNREIVVGNARSRVLARRKALEKRTAPMSSPELQKDRESMKWRNAVSLKEKAVELRGRADARKLRARSRWLSAIGSSTNS
jgi:hypothetical protein